jgi:hypothetical protein
MPSPTMEKLRDRWEAMQERERRLVLVLGVTIVVCAFLWVAFTIRGGLSSIEAKNEATREALLSLAEYRASGGAKGAADTVEIPAEAIKLSRYLETIIKESGLKSPTYPQEKETTKGDYTEVSFAIQMSEISVFELKDLLEKIESRNRAVVVRELKIKRKVSDQEKLDVTMTVSTFRKASKKEKGKDGDGGDGDEEKSSSKDEG